MIDARITGLPDLRAAFANVPVRLRKRAIAAAWRKAGRLVRDMARKASPVLNTNNASSASALRRGVRKAGTVRKAISLRTSKRDRRSGDVGVFVNVRPAKAGNRGAKNPNDPFYWRWLEFGRTARGKGSRVEYATGGKLKTRTVKRNTGKTDGAKFLQNADRAFPAALQVFIREIVPALRKLNVRSATP